MHRAWVCLAISSIVTAACGEGTPSAPRRAAEVIIQPESAGVDLYDTLALQATVRDDEGHLLIRVLTWESSASGYVYVRETGVVHALSRGSATITATVDGASGQAKISVVAPIIDVRLTPNPAAMMVGDTLRLTVRLASTDGLPPTDSALTWTSSDTSVAVVTAGLVTARDTGAVVITATARRAAGATTVNVLSPP